MEFWQCCHWDLSWKDMIGSAKGPRGEFIDEGVIITYFFGVQGLLGPRGDCESFVSCGKNLHGRKGNYFNYRALLI